MVESVANPETVLVGTSLEGFPNLYLRVILSLEVVEPVTAGYEIVVAHELGVDTEQAINHTIVDEGTRHQFLAERQSEILNLADGKRQRW